MSAAGAWWRPALGALAFVVWAPPALLGLPFAALVAATAPRRARERWTAALVGVASMGLLLGPADGMLGASVAAYVVLLTAAFVLLARYAPRPFLGQALRATALAAIGTAALAWLTWGPGFWRALHWEAARHASLSARLFLPQRPELVAVLDATARVVGDTVPATLALQTLAGLALAWQWHRRVAARPLGEPLGAFRELRFSDHWVWGVVAALVVWVVPPLAVLKTAALNLAVVAGALYLLRGVAIVTAVAGMLGVSVATLALGAAVAAVLAVPLLFVVPGLLTLGVADTWLEFRRRFAARFNAL